MTFENLAGKRALGIAHSKDYTDWAESLLYENIDSKNISILAGLGVDKDPDSMEVERYFQECLLDLGLKLPSKQDGLLSYAKYLCNQVVNDEMSSLEGLAILETFYSNSDYEAIYSIWSELSEDVWMVNNRESSIFNTGLTKDNVDIYIKNVATQFIDLVEMNLPERFFYNYACSDCGYVGESKLERIDKPWLPEKIFRLIYHRGPTLRSKCAKCGVPFPKNMRDYEGRKQYLELINR